jgi:hypothetical protein
MEVALPGDVLSALASDVTIAIGLSVGNVLTEGLMDDDYTSTELVAVLLILNVITAAAATAIGRRSKHDSIGGFLSVFFELCHRLSRMTLASVVSGVVVKHQPLRAVRILELLSVAFFFVYVGATPNAHLKRR